MGRSIVLKFVSVVVDGWFVLLMVGLCCRVECSEGRKLKVRHGVPPQHENSFSVTLRNRYDKSHRASSCRTLNCYAIPSTLPTFLLSIHSVALPLLSVILIRRTTIAMSGRLNKAQAIVQHILQLMPLPRRCPPGATRTSGGPLFVGISGPQGIGNNDKLANSSVIYATSIDCTVH